MEYCEALVTQDEDVQRRALEVRLPRRGASQFLFCQYPPSHVFFMCTAYLLLQVNLVLLYVCSGRAHYIAVSIVHCCFCFSYSWELMVALSLRSLYA